MSIFFNEITIISHVGNNTEAIKALFTISYRGRRNGREAEGKRSVNKNWKYWKRHMFQVERYYRGKFLASF